MNARAVNEDVPLLIAGSGLVGLSTAMFLSQHGVASLVARFPNLNQIEGPLRSECCPHERQLSYEMTGSPTRSISWNRCTSGQTMPQ
jgi:hypothetical protein